MLQTVPKKIIDKIKTSSYVKDITKLATGSLLAQIITFACMPIFSRIYNPDDFALCNLFMQISAFVMLLSTLRYELFIQLPKRNKNARRLIEILLLWTICFTVITSIIFFIFRIDIAKLAGDPGLAKWVLFIPLSAALTAWAYVFQAWVQRMQLYKRSAQAEVTAKSSYVSIVFLGKVYCSRRRIDSWTDWRTGGKINIFVQKYAEAFIQDEQNTSECSQKIFTSFFFNLYFTFFPLCRTVCADYFYFTLLWS